jgi:hypothetical protein
MEILMEKNDYIVKCLIKTHHNDGDLGWEIRKIFPTDSLVKKFPNNMELGYNIRKIYNSEEYID